MSQCFTPFYKKNENIPLPCGRCPMCLKRRASGWSFRLVKEGERALSSFFITLTYNTQHVPITQKGFMSLSKRDLQLFIKRLRKNETTTDQKQFPIKYYAVGEYGGKTNRPHYHLILFNASISSIQKSWVSRDGVSIGEIHYGTVSEASIGYALKYMHKKNKGERGSWYDGERQFALMSKRLGSNYLSTAVKKWHTNDLDKRFYIPLKDGKKIAMPRYFKDKIYNSEQLGHLKGVMEKLSQEKIKELEKEYGDNLYYELSQQHIHAFKQLHKNATKNDKL